MEKKLDTGGFSAPPSMNVPSQKTLRHKGARPKSPRRFGKLRRRKSVDAGLGTFDFRASERSSDLAKPRKKKSFDDLDIKRKDVQERSKTLKFIKKFKLTGRVKTKKPVVSEKVTLKLEESDYLFVECLEWIIVDERMKSPGVFRRPGEGAKIIALQDHILANFKLAKGERKHEISDIYPEPTLQDIFVVADLLKRSLRERSTKLLDSHTKGFLDAVHPSLEQMEVLRDQLPKSRLLLLSKLLLFLHRLQEFSTENLMPSTNIAIVFGPVVIEWSEAGIGASAMFAVPMFLTNWIQEAPSLFAVKRMKKSLQRSLSKRRFSRIASLERKNSISSLCSPSPLLQRSRFAGEVDPRVLRMTVAGIEPPAPLTSFRGSPWHNRQYPRSVRRGKEHEPSPPPMLSMRSRET